MPTRWADEGLRGLDEAADSAAADAPEDSAVAVALADLAAADVPVGAAAPAVAVPDGINRIINDFGTESMPHSVPFTHGTYNLLKRDFTNG